MNILLLSPPKETIYGFPIMPRLGLAYLSASLKNNGIDHEILDLNLYRDWKKALSAKLGKFSLFGIASTTFEFDAAKKVAAYIKNYSSYSKVILGGPHPTLMGNEILKNCKEIDYCIRGEGEESLIKLIHLIESGREKGIKLLKGAVIKDLDKIPFPNYDKFELDKYPAFPNTLPLLTSRGCPSGCIYCSVGMIMGRKFRKRSPQNIVEEIEYLTARYKTSFFQFIDDNFTLDIKRAKEICRCIIKKDLDIKWSLPNGIRVDRIDEELVALMKKAGCIKIAIGIESTNDKVLRNRKRGMSLEIVKKGISLIQKYKIATKGFFLIGSPGETKEDVHDDVEFAIKQRLDEVGFNMLTPYPGSELWNWVRDKGYWTVKEPLEKITKYTHRGKVKAIYETPSLSGKEKEEAYREVQERWNKYRLNKTLKGRIILRLKGCPWVYTLIRRLYRLFKTR